MSSVNTSRANVAGVDVDTRHWIGGQRVSSVPPGAGGTFTDLSPIDEKPLAELARGSAAEVDAAVRAAHDAFAGWSATPAPDRAAVLHAIADGIEARAAELAAVETADNGALLRSHVNSVMPRAAHNFRFFADWLGELDGGDMEIRGHREQVSWAPSGVTAVITPWNAPLMLATWRIAPALAAGNPVVAKPPEWAPLTASLLADISAAAGLPDGVFNVVQGLGEEAGAPLAAHPGLARVCFTGSVATGRLVAAAAGGQLTPASLELGGKSPFVVFADADLDLAVRHAVGQYDNAGQVCLAGSRLLVEETVAAEFLARFTERAQALRQGDPRDESTDVGPNITRQHLERVDGFVRRAVAAGQSGIGREGGTWSFDFYADVKNTVYAPEGWTHG
jgi:5-carboxymethyl-2-hydroxymuconic-semialdehyde dehydrogenase